FKEKKQKFFSYLCAKVSKEKNKLKESLKTHKDYLKDFERVFNRFIRERDRGLPCVSCGQLPPFTLSAGHYFPAGSNPSVRFDERNVHGQCWFNCNKNKHGNQANYYPELVQRIGSEQYELLATKARQESVKLTIPEIQDLIEQYKQKTKALCKQRTTT
ncbi:MAG: recombination protein NinG, partial [Weeksellaceae bacterium]|nr:recombination protein NinG [Weeksellaceae bacterium]